MTRFIRLTWDDQDHTEVVVNPDAVAYAQKARGGTLLYFLAADSHDENCLVELRVEEEFDLVATLLGEV